MYIHQHHLLFFPLLLVSHSTKSKSITLIIIIACYYYSGCTRLINTWYHLQSIYISSTRTIILQPIRIGPPLEASIPKTTPSNKDCTSPPKITTTITITRATQDHSQTVPCFFFVFGILSYSSTVTADKISEEVSIYPGPAKPAREQRAFLQQTRKQDNEPFIHHESE